MHSPKKAYSKKGDGLFCLGGFRGDTFLGFFEITCA